MHRRDFFKRSAKTAIAGSAFSVAGNRCLATTDSVKPANSATNWASYTEEDHRRRLQNLANCHCNIHTCMRKHLISDYLPGQCVYNMYEYPGRKPWAPDETDDRELDRLQSHGIQLIQVFEEWMDPLRLFGGDRYTSPNPKGLRRFIDMVHQRGMKMILYASIGFFDKTNPDLRPKWAAKDAACSLGWWDMAYCSPASPGWRAYLLPRLSKILDEYGADGLYIDAGYVTNSVKARVPKTSPLKGRAEDAIDAFEETPHHDGALTDLMALIYGEVKRRRGILKLHVSTDQEPCTAGQKVYDYLWVGEGVDNADGLRETVKNYTPYVVPCIDMTFANVDKNEQYLHAIPYMQFPVLQAGRPYTGERGMIPGIHYVSDDDFWMQRCRKIWKHYQSNPNGPYSYGHWDAVPGCAETQPTHAHWLKQYLPLVEEGTWAWLEIGESELFASPLPKEIVASVFANRELYIVLANYSQSPQRIETTNTYVPIDIPSAVPAKQWQLPGRSLCIVNLFEGDLLS